MGTAQVSKPFLNAQWTIRVYTTRLKLIPQEYLLIDQYRIHVDHYVKTGDNQWLLSEYDDVAIALTLPTLGIELTMADIYEDIDSQAAQV